MPGVHLSWGMRISVIDGYTKKSRVQLCARHSCIQRTVSISTHILLNPVITCNLLYNVHLSLNYRYADMYKIYTRKTNSNVRYKQACTFCAMYVYYHPDIVLYNNRHGPVENTARHFHDRITMLRILLYS